MNRKKMILLLTGIESMLLVILTMLYFNGAIGIRMYCGVVLLLAILCSALVVVIMRKLNG